MARRLKAVVFEVADGGWIGSMPVHHSTRLWSLTDADLTELLEQAIGRG
jgi:hypothetical protein